MGEQLQIALQAIRVAVATLPEYPAGPGETAELDDDQACDVAWVRDQLSAALAQIERGVTA